MGRFVLPMAVLLALSAGAAVSNEPAMLVGVFAPAVLILLSTSSIARLTFFVGAGLLVFGGATVGPAKYGFMAGAVLVTAVSLSRVCASKSAQVAAFKPCLMFAGLFVAWIEVSFFVSRSEVSTGNWFRDGFPYLMIAMAIVVGLDAAADLREDVLPPVIAVIGLVAAVAFAADWLQRRGVAALPIGHFLLATPILAAAGFAMSIALAAAWPSRLRWPTLAVTIAAILLSTGSRTMVILAVGLVGVIGARKQRRLPLGRATVMGAGLAVALAWTLPRVVGLVVADPAFLEGRTAAALLAITSGGQDESYRIRARSYGEALTAFHEHIWLGTGPGYLYPQGVFTLDTPLIIPAKLGLIGTSLLIGLLASTAWAVWTLAGRHGWSVASNGVRAWCLILLAFIPFGVLVEDKGFAFAVSLMVASAAANKGEQDTTLATADVQFGRSDSAPSMRA